MEKTRERALELAVQRSRPGIETASDIVRAAREFLDFLNGTRDAEVIDAARKLADTITSYGSIFGRQLQVFIRMLSQWAIRITQTEIQIWKGSYFASTLHFARTNFMAADWPFVFSERKPLGSDST